MTTSSLSMNPAHALEVNCVASITHDVFWDPKISKNMLEEQLCSLERGGEFRQGNKMYELGKSVNYDKDFPVIWADR